MINLSLFNLFDFVSFTDENGKSNNIDLENSSEELSYSKNLYELSEEDESLLIRKYMKPKITLHKYDEDEDEEMSKEYNLKKKKKKNEQKRHKEDESEEE